MATPEDSIKNLNTIIDGILQANPQTEIILQTMNPVKDKPGQGVNGGASQRPKLADYIDGYRQVARDRGLRLVDHFPNWRKLMLENPAEFDRLVPDGIHPRAEGYRTVLLPELQRPLAPPPPPPFAYLQNPGDHGMTVCLLAPSGTTREVRVAVAATGTAKPEQWPALATPIPDTTWTKWQVRLRGLKPGTSYQYQVSYLLDEQPAATPVCHFNTLDPQADKLKAIAFNDTHNIDRVVATLMPRIKPEDFEFTLLLGDILEGSRKDGRQLTEFVTTRAR